MRSHGPELTTEEWGDGRRLVRALLAHHAERLWSFEAAAREGVDPEGVHQMRVQTRRLRVLLRGAGEALPAAVVGALRRLLAGLAARLGAVRDPEVLSTLLEGLEERAQSPAERRALRRRRTALRAVRMQAHAELCAYLASSSATALRQRLARVARSPVRGEVLPGDAFAAAVVHRWLRRVGRRARAARGQEAETLHELRRALKGLRYCAEGFERLLPRRARSLARRAAWLQERLGAIHDLDVALGFAAGHGALTATLRGDREALLRGVERRLRSLLRRRRDPAR